MCNYMEGNGCNSVAVLALVDHQCQVKLSAACMNLDASELTRGVSIAGAPSIPTASLKRSKLWQT